MTTADRHADTDPNHGGGSYRASDVDTTAQDDAARFDTTEDGTGREGGYAQHHDEQATGGYDTTGTSTTTDEHHVDGTTDTADTVDTVDTADSTDHDSRAGTEGGHPHGTGSLDGSDPGLDGHATGRHADGHTGTDAGTDAGTDTTATATDTAATDSAASTTGTGTGSDKLERLVPTGRVDEYQSRWDAVKGEFVDEPRQAVAKADKLVGELLDELDQLFRKQRSDLEHGLDADETSTEDLRLALRRYRSFFDRLLAL